MGPIADLSGAPGPDSVGSAIVNPASVDFDSIGSATVGLGSVNLRSGDFSFVRLTPGGIYLRRCPCCSVGWLFD